MKIGRLAFIALMATLLCMADTHAQESSKLQFATGAIVSGLIAGRNPKTRLLCTEMPCLGVSQSELGLAFIAARKTPASLRTLVELIRFHMDAGLAANYDCAIVGKRMALHKMRKWIVSLKPTELKERCANDYTLATGRNSAIFPPADVNLLCRTEAEIEAARKEMLDQVSASGRSCPP